MAIDNSKGGRDGVLGDSRFARRNDCDGRRTGVDGVVPQREAVERVDKAYEEEEMIVTGYGSDGSRAMIVTDDPKTLAWFAARFERTEYKTFNKGVSNGRDS